MRLAEQECEALVAGMQPLSPEEAEELARQVPAWTRKGDAIERELQFEDFQEAMDFVNDVADLAQEQDHHPDIYISYDKVRLEFSTHNIGGLSKNDFIMAAKVDQLV
jgi:4a-hydroxytetrahydrobiopterin dehydratase